MQILHVLAERGFSGGEVQLRYLLDYLRERGHDSRLVLQPGARFADTAREFGVSVEEVRMRNGMDLRACVRIREAVRRSGADLVHFACSRSHKLGALAMLGLDLPRVVTRRMDYPLRFRVWSRWLYASAVDAAVVISRGVQAELERVGVPRRQIKLIYEGVDPRHFEGVAAGRAVARRALGLPSDSVVISCAASLTRRKGQVHLLRAFAALAERFPAAHLLLAGQGPEKVALERCREQLGLARRVVIPGQISVEDALAVADLGCMPSLREGLSVFCLEAASTGLPMVASRVGGLPESVADGETGLLAEPGNEADLAAALARLLGDAELRVAMGRAARARVRRQFDARQMAATTESFYQELVRCHPHPEVSRE